MRRTLAALAVLGSLAVAGCSPDPHPTGRSGVAVAVERLYGECKSGHEGKPIGMTDVGQGSYGETSSVVVLCPDGTALELGD